MAGFNEVFQRREGIFAISLSSQFNGFMSWHNITVDKTISASYDAPAGYVEANRGKYVGPDGVGETIAYMPKLIFQMQQHLNINYLASSAPTTTGPVLGADKIDELASNAFDPHATLRILLTALGVSNIPTAGPGIDIMASLGQTFKAHPFLLARLAAGMSITPISFMQSLYGGMGLVVVQESLEQFTLTTMDNALGGIVGSVSVNPEKIVSMRPSFDFTRLPATIAIGVESDGSLSNNNMVTDGTTNPIINQKRYEGDSDIVRHSGFGVNLSSASVQVPSVLFGITLDNLSLPSGGKVSIPGIGDIDVEEVEVVEKSAVGGTTSYKAINAASIYHAVRKHIMEKLQDSTGAQYVMSGANGTAVIDDTVIPMFSSFNGSGGTSIQKQVLRPGSNPTLETEQLPSLPGGICVGTSMTMAQGILTAQVTYLPADWKSL